MLLFTTKLRDWNDGCEIINLKEAQESDTYFATPKTDLILSIHEHRRFVPRFLPLPLRCRRPLFKLEDGSNHDIVAFFLRLALSFYSIHELSNTSE